MPVEWTGRDGAKVSVDFGGTNQGPVKPHVGWQTPGKRNLGGGQRGHNLLDVNPRAGRNLGEYANWWEWLK
jgi:hypothetical protein